MGGKETGVNEFEEMCVCGNPTGANLECERCRLVRRVVLAEGIVRRFASGRAECRTVAFSVGQIDLAPCPFCNRTDMLSVEPHPESKFIGIRCRACGCVGPSKTSENETEAAAHWNVRKSIVGNRYWLFAGDCFYARGGMHDFCGEYETVELAMQHAFYEWWHVWDAIHGKCVAASERQPHGAPNQKPRS